MEKSLSTPETPHVLFASSQSSWNPMWNAKNKLLPQAMEELDAIYLIIRNICSNH
jgi:hypothetical protein